MTAAERLARQIMDAPTIEAAQAHAERVLASRRASRARTAPRRKAGDEAKRLSREERREKVSAIRAAAWDFTGGRCLVCMGLLGEEWHLHHVVGGGLRRKLESDRNTVALCPHCHRAAHRNDLATLNALLNWALANGDAYSRMALTARVAKLHDARRASSVRRAEGGRP